MMYLLFFSEYIMDDVGSFMEALIGESIEEREGGERKSRKEREEKKGCEMGWDLATSVSRHL